VVSNRSEDASFDPVGMLCSTLCPSQAARASGSPLPLGAAAHAVYEMMKAQGQGHLDFGSVYLLLSGELPQGAKK